jgi:hypothetical protein
LTVSGLRGKVARLVSHAGLAVSMTIHGHLFSYGFRTELAERS